MRFKPVILVTIVALAVALALTVSIPASAKTTSLPTKFCNDGICVIVNQQCSVSKHIPVTLTVTGLDANGVYLTTATYPDTSKYYGTEYPPSGLDNLGAGIADKNGHAPNWSWKCWIGADRLPGSVDPNGIYNAQIVEGRSREYVQFKFRVTP